MTLPEPGVYAPLLPPGKLELKYLFSAQLTDGTEIFQTAEDKHPSVVGRNAFYELLALDDKGNQLQHANGSGNYCRSDIALFQLEDQHHRYLVDLRDGHFEVQHAKGRSLIGAHFFIQFPPPGEKLRLFYFRIRRHHTNVSGTVQEDRSVKVNDTVEIAQECEYHFGWETEDRTVKAELILV